MVDENDLPHRGPRARAIEDGALIDVSAIAMEVGVLYATALSRAVWQRYVFVPPGGEGEDEDQRRRDLASALHHAIKSDLRPGDELSFTAFIRTDSGGARPVTLKAVCEADDDGAPCLTMLLPDEG
jgi:hypothetical protein